MSPPTLTSRPAAAAARALGALRDGERRRRWAKLALGFVTPYSLVQLRNRRFHERRWDEARRILAERSAESESRDVEPFDHEAAIGFLVRERGLSEFHVREGSIRADALEFAGEVLDEHLPAGRPVVGLQVGNFVGVSLVFLSELLCRRDTGSIMISIDPNIRHRGIDDPQSHVWALLDRFGLAQSNLVVTGYSLEQTIGDLPESSAQLEAERRAEHLLPNLGRLLPGGVHLAIIDGNHDGEYLERELRALRPALCAGAIVVIDDVELAWVGVLETFERAAGPGSDFVVIGRDAGLGILQLAAVG